MRIDDAIEYSQSLKGFVKMIKLLRVVFLQDCSVLLLDHPDSFIFQHSLFKTKLFHDFHERMKAIYVLECDNPSRSFQDIAPQIGYAMNNLKQSVCDNICNQSQLIRGDLNRFGNSVQELLPQIQTLLDTAIQNINFSVNVSSLRPELSNTNLAPEIPPPILDNEEDENTIARSNDIIRYEMSRSISTVVELWNEFTNGICHQRSIQSLEGEFGDKWRGGSRSGESKFYLGRLLIVQEVRKLLAVKDLKSSLLEVEERRVELGSLHKLMLALRKAKKN